MSRQVPSHVQREARKFLVWRAYKRLEKELGWTPSYKQVSEYTGVSLSSMPYYARQLNIGQRGNTFRSYDEDYRELASRKAGDHHNTPDLCQLIGGY